MRICRTANTLIYNLLQVDRWQKLFSLSGLSVIHVATLKGSKNLVATILDMGANVDEQVGKTQITLKKNLFSDRPQICKYVDSFEREKKHLGEAFEKSSKVW